MSILFLIIFTIFLNNVQSKAPVSSNVYDICNQLNGKKMYIELEETGTIVANYQNNNLDWPVNSTHYKCTIEFLTCPSCIIEIKFR